ncbi:hypothetical protein C8F04DRAFT_1189672 [Mycena alexandri]|uniref:Uncharacterized protein n=1 Tax=Mycena alexandri TaxID=1745969 RepID=A0AAD6SFY9_9AGAR|nr:hypothetical protein C8F04DRAFT_1189672 [Mycena alexandri]
MQNNVFTAQYWCKYYTGGVPAYPYGWGTAYKYYTGRGTSPPVQLGHHIQILYWCKYYTGGVPAYPYGWGYPHTNIIPASAHYQLGQALPLSPIFVSEASHDLGGSLPPVLGASHIMAGSLPKVTDTGSNLQWEACLG